MKLTERICETCGENYTPLSGKQRYCSRQCIPCGTYSGWNAHQRNSEPPCDACRAAQAAYVRQRRKTNPDIYKREKDRDKARVRALWKLAEKYPKAYQRLYKAELRRVAP